MSRLEEAIAKANQLRHNKADAAAEPETTVQAVPDVPAVPESTSPSAAVCSPAAHTAAQHKPGNGLKIVRYIAGISLLVATAIAMYGYKGEAPVESQPKPPKVKVSSPMQPAAQPAGQQPAPEKPIPEKMTLELTTQKKTRMPSLIPLDAPDSAYAAANPGWQRYESKTMEFRIFRKDNMVTAIQVLSKQGTLIPAEFFASFLTEIAGRDSFRAKTKEEKDEYSIEKGVAGDTAKVIVYRKKATGEIKAFVVSYP
jgi:hypothetical protein